MKVQDNEIFFAKIKQNAIIPTKKDEDAGYDIYACFDEDYFVIMPGETRAVPSGIAAAFSSKYYAQIEERSSTSKIGIKKSGGVFDSGYRGEYLIMLYNTRSIPFVITKIASDDVPEEFEIDGKRFKKSGVLLYPYTKAICEAVLQEIPKLESKEISYEELLQISSERGVGGFGSSGK